MVSVPMVSAPAGTAAGAAAAAAGTPCGAAACFFAWQQLVDAYQDQCAHEKNRHCITDDHCHKSVTSLYSGTPGDLPKSVCCRIYRCKAPSSFLRYIAFSDQHIDDTADQYNADDGPQPEGALP